MSIRDLVPRFGRAQGERLPQRRSEADPFRLFQQQMNRLFDDFFEGGLAAPSWSGRAGLDAAGYSPRVDIAETDTEVKVSAELPGMDEKEVTVELDDNTISIRGEKTEEKEEKKGNWTHREQLYGAFHRTIPLPAAVDGQKAKATFRKGVLTVSVPKREPGKNSRKLITIESD